MPKLNFLNVRSHISTYVCTTLYALAELPTFVLLKKKKKYEDIRIRVMQNIELQLCLAKIGSELQTNTKKFLERF